MRSRCFLSVPSRTRRSSGDANAAATARLPQEVLENILLRLPASDLRRFHRVCKEWHGIISDPIFIRAHMVHGPTAPTHTIVFVPSSKQRTNNGFLFDERWRLTARFTAGESEVMIGTCNGLLCFHDGLHDVIKVVEPFTGEAIALPLPIDSSWRRFARSYCFGFDDTARQYKIVHQAFSCNFLKVFTVGSDKDWRTMSIPYTSLGDLACNEYWSYKDGTRMYAGFDLATEQITSIKRCLANRRLIFCRHPWWQRDQPCIIRIWWLASESQSESQGGYWPSDMDAMAFDTDCINLTQGRHLPRPHALQRGHVLLQEANGALYAHKIMSRSIHDLELGCEKLLLGSGVEEEPAKSMSTGQFVPVHSSRGQSRTRLVATASEDIRAFAYAPTVSPAPLALYLGTPMST